MATPIIIMTKGEVSNYLRIEERRWNDEIFDSSLITTLTKEENEWRKVEEVEVPGHSHP